tara:strand:- start:162 stop:602 length:441 start_codon:yes stop_codon:yes gene_type:complete
MSGKMTVIIILGSSFCFGILFFYFQTFAYYQEVLGLQSITVDSRKIEVWDYKGIRASTSALKMRSCFNAEVRDFQDLTLAKNPQPLSAPFWFSCFNSKDLQNAIDDGRAKAYIAVENERKGVDRLVIIYPDGKGYEWRQLNKKYLY